MKCPNCKAENPNEAMYCNKCGNTLLTTNFFQPTSIPPPTNLKYSPPEVKLENQSQSRLSMGLAIASIIISFYCWNIPLFMASTPVIIALILGIIAFSLKRKLLQIIALIFSGFTMIIVITAWST